MLSLSFPFAPQKIVQVKFANSRSLTPAVSSEAIINSFNFKIIQFINSVRKRYLSIAHYKSHQIDEVKWFNRFGKYYVSSVLVQLIGRMKIQFNRRAVRRELSIRLHQTCFV